MPCNRGSESHPENVDLSTSISGLRLNNPLILASGILGLSGKLLRKIGEMGAGALVTKSFSIRVREGYPGPVIVEVPCGYLNSMGLPNPGVDEMRNVIVEAKKCGVPVIASIFGFDEDEYGDAAAASMEAGADAIELNVSCPHVSEVGVEIGRKPDIVSRVTSKAKSRFKGPVIVKLSPNVTDIVEIAKAAANGGADALTATNTIKAIAIDVEAQRPILGGKYGGLSGPALKPIALRYVYELYERVELPIIGCGGVTCWTDIVEYLLAGASAVQVGSALASRELSIFKELCEDLSRYMSNHGLKSIKEIVGKAHIQT
ncbi:MAG: dihydroorotate dehydrogenase [Candidatus Bathyarchaeia archaeon]